MLQALQDLPTSSILSNRIAAILARAIAGRRWHVGVALFEVIEALATSP